MVLVNIANALEVSLDEIVYDSLIKNEHISIKEINELLVDCEREELTALIQIVKTTKNIMRNIKK